MKNNVQNPFFSIIISSYNAEQYLENALISIVNQLISSYEIIVIDGASNDKTISIIEKYLDKIAYFESQPDNGIYDAWNKAIKHANGKWFYFLGADDYLIDSKALHRVEEGIKKIESNSILVVYTMVQVYDDKSNASWVSNRPWQFLKKNFFQINCLHHQGVFHKKEIFKIHGDFDISFKIAGDYEYLLRVFTNHDPAFIETLVCCSRTGGYSTNIFNSKKALKECNRARKLHGRNIIGFYWIYAYIKLIFKIILLKLLKAQRTESIISWYRKTLKSKLSFQKFDGKK